MSDDKILCTVESINRKNEKPFAKVVISVPQDLAADIALGDCMLSFQTPTMDMLRGKK